MDIVLDIKQTDFHCTTVAYYHTFILNNARLHDVCMFRSASHYVTALYNYNKKLSTLKSKTKGLLSYLS